MIYLLPLLFFLLAGCSLRSTYPFIGGVIGGSAGTLTGGPVAGGLSAGAGVLAGEAMKNADALVEAEETIEALSHGDVTALVAQGMAEHKSGVQGFMDKVKQWLLYAAIALGAYLGIPIFIAKRTARSCSKSEFAKQATRPPFPVKPPPR